MTTTTSDLTSHAQLITDQPDGPGRRIGQKGELTLIAELTPDGAAIFRERLPELQAQAGYWEPIVATVENFRVLLIDNDTRMLITLIFDGDFLPYLADIGKAAPWLDRIFGDIIAGYASFTDPGTAALVVSKAYTAELYFHAFPDKSVQEVHKMTRLNQAVSDLLDAAS